MKNYIIDNFKILFSRRQMHEANESVTTLICMSLFLAIISLILTVFNLLKGYWFMAGTTSALILGFLAAGFLFHRRKAFAARCILALLCGIIFSVYAVLGENNGFAILWILLVPIIGMSIISLQLGFYLSLYFLVFLIVLFYTPLSHIVMDYYTATFRMRFPVLYFAAFGAVTFLMCQRQMLFNQVHWQAYHDPLTGLNNRLYYNEIRKETDRNSSYRNMSVVALDLNQLKAANDTYGHDAGDEIIAATAQLLLAAFGEDDCFRLGGDEFAVISKGSVQEKVAAFQNSVKNWTGVKVPYMNISVGIASRAEHPEMNFEELTRLADQNMYADKSAFYRQNGINRRQS